MSESENYIGYFKSPIGILKLSANDLALTSIDFTDISEANLLVLEILENPIIHQAKEELDAYFKNELRIFQVPVAPNGTDFQKKVWNELLEINYGKTVSYKDISLNMNAPKAIRAIGTANGANPIPIIIPCHRVIGSNHRLVGYRGELWRKQFLLELEGSLSLKLF